MSYGTTGISEVSRTELAFGKAINGRRKNTKFGESARKPRLTVGFHALFQFASLRRKNAIHGESAFVEKIGERRIFTWVPPDRVLVDIYGAARKRKRTHVVNALTPHNLPRSMTLFDQIEESIV